MYRKATFTFEKLHLMLKELLMLEQVLLELLMLEQVQAVCVLLQLLPLVRQLAFVNLLLLPWRVLNCKRCWR